MTVIGVALLSTSRPFSLEKTGGDVTYLSRGTPPSQVITYDVISSVSSEGCVGIERWHPEDAAPAGGLEWLMARCADRCWEVRWCVPPTRGHAQHLMQTSPRWPCNVFHRGSRCPCQRFSPRAHG